MHVAAGAALGCAAALFLWAARELGWRRACGLADEPRRPEEPRLVLGGPFRIVRHPESSAAILALLGAGLARPSPAVALAVGAAIAGIAARARRSESGLIERFGDVYRRYQRAVPFLVPRAAILTRILDAARRGA